MSLYPLRILGTLVMYPKTHANLVGGLRFNLIRLKLVFAGDRNPSEHHFLCEAFIFYQNREKSFRLLAVSQTGNAILLWDHLSMIKFSLLP